MAITNNGARSRVAGMAHLFCELFYRAREAGLNDGMTWDFPVSLTQLGETPGMAIATVHRIVVDASGLVIPFGLERGLRVYRERREGSRGNDAGPCPRHVLTGGLVRSH
jgi:hypothetical protein